MIEAMYKMDLKKLVFLGINENNPETLKGLILDIVVNGEFKGKVFIQKNAVQRGREENSTHAKIIGKGFDDKHLPLKGNNDYSYHIQEVERQAKIIYGSNGSGKKPGLFRKGPEIKVQQSYSLK